MAGLLFRMFRVDRIEVRGTMHGVQVQLVIGELRTELGMLIQNGVALDEEKLLFLAGGQDNAVDEDVDEQPVQDLTLNVEADDYPVCNEASPSYDSNILSEVHDHDHYQDAICEHHEAHEMYHDVQPNCFVDSHADYTSDSNMILYDQYVKDNAVPVVKSNVSSVPNDAYMMILDDMHKRPTQYVSVTTQNNVVDKSLTAELATYKEQVELYERRAKFELTEREQKIEEQLRIIITDRNLKEENLKKELHSVKMQLTSTINHNKSMVEEVEDKLYKQDQSLQTVHVLCKPKPYYDEQNKVAIDYKNPLCLTRVKQVQPALYNGHEIIKTNHVPTIVHNSEDTLEIAEITRKKMDDKMKDPEYIFKELEAEVDQNAVNRKHDEIERKNLLIANDNLITDCLSKEVFYIATNSELMISRFTEMHDAHTTVQARCLELEAELSKLHDKIQKDDHTELVKCFSNPEINHLNLQLKYQNLKESFGNNTSLPTRDAPDFDSVFVIKKMKASIQGKDNAIKKLRMQISQLKETRSEADRTLDFRALDF
ncbi:hypothetical protein Tco_1041046 [Tanacetum coccineum]|uniref:Uncharacterized protein n=1 Tax=Tanacetum coccineum TaxID=301880 RepID=A0ABQ5GGJ6_9ASTR